MKIFFSSSLLFLGFSISIHAQENADNIKPSYQYPSSSSAVRSYNITDPDLAILSPITITASSSISDELLSAKSVSIYSKKDITKSGATSLLDFFKYNTEIEIDPSFGNVLNNKISMRGFGQGDGHQNINIIVDGISLNQIDLVPQQLGSIPVNSIEKIEVLKSSGSVLYGDNSAAGTIIIHTNNSFDRKQLFGSLKSSYGTYQTRLVHANLGAVTQYKGINILTDVKFSYLGNDGKKQVLADGSRDTTENLNGKATLGFKTDNFELLSSYLKDESKVIYTGNMSPTDFNQDPGSRVTTGTPNIVRIENISTSIKYKFNDIFNLAYAFSIKDRVSKFPRFNFVSDYEGHDHRLTLQTIQDNFIVLAGVEYKYNDRKNSTNITAKETLAGFISADYFINDRLSLNAGFRQATIKFKHDDSSNNTHLKRSLTPNAYNAAINFSVTKTDAFSFSYQHAYQSPDIDRFFNTNFFTRITSFNGFINTMMADTYSIAFKHLEDDLKFKLELFHIDLDNEIFFNSSTFTNTNFDTSEKNGLEVSLYKDFGLFYSNINYVYTDTQTKLGSQTYELSGQPHHVVLALIGKQFDCSILPLPHHSITFSHKYKSKSYALDDFDNSLGKQQNYNSTAFNYQLSDQKHWTADFSIHNLFDQQNGQFVDFGLANPVVYPTNYERTFSGSIKYTF